MKRKFESGASKRRRKQLDEASAKDFRPITSFLEQEYQLYPTNTSLVDDNSENSISMHEHEEIGYGNTPVINVTGDPIYNQEAQQQQVDRDLTRMTISLFLHVFIYWNCSLNSSSGLGLSDSLRGPDSNIRYIRFSPT